jgi:hypothetical protein
MKTTNSELWRSLNVCLCILLLATGCGENAKEPQPMIPAGATRPYTKAELDKLIVPGLKIGEVTNLFRPPASEIRLSEHAATLLYVFPLETITREGGLRMTGFDVHLKDGKVVAWSPMMGESKKAAFAAGGSPSSFGEQSFQIFLATGSLTNLVTIVDSEGSADISNIKASPEMAFRAKVFAGRSGSERPDEQTVILVVNDQDAAKLKTLSEENLGQRLLIVCRTNVISAPTILAPLSSPQLMFTVKNSVVLESLQSQ